MKFIFILILLFFSCTPPLPEKDNFSECNAPYGWDCGDIKVLQAFIDDNSHIFRHYMDYNGNGIIEPLELGYQVWDEGRLIELDISYNENIIMKPDNPSELDITNYRLTVIPDNIGDLDSVKYLLLNGNEFSSIPESIGDLINLEKIDIENNLITDLPDEIGNLINLEILKLSFNLITALPETIGSLISLKKLWLSYNKLYALPESIVNLSQLEWLYLNDNLLESFPDGIGALNALRLLNTKNNRLSYLPNNLCEIYPGEWNCEEDSEGMCIGSEICITPPKCLEFLSIGNNELCQEGIPPCVNDNFGNQSCAYCDPWEFNIGGYCADSLDYQILQNFLDLNPESQALPGGTGIPDSANQCINDEWWDDGRLVEITFQHKQLNSTIPENIGNLEKLKVLRLTGNYLRGEIPESITNLKKLEILKLNSNYLSGSIPQNIGELSMIDTIWLTDNSLGCYNYNYECDEDGNNKEFCCITHCDLTDDCSAIIPESITELTQLQALHLEENLISGIIPSNIGDIDSLKYLYLDNNLIVGEIPNSLGNLPILRRLKLLRNELSGQIPDNICNLYENDLGPQFSFRAYFNNNNLCPGASGYPTCIPESHLGTQYCSP